MPMKFRNRVLRQTQKCDRVKLNPYCNTDIYKPLRTGTYQLPHKTIDRQFIMIVKGFIGLVRAVVVMIVWQLDLQLPMQSVPITTEVVSSNPVHGELYSILHYVIKFVSDLRHLGGFMRVTTYKINSMGDEYTI